jgi:hypothetical protein
MKISLLVPAIWLTNGALAHPLGQSLTARQSAQRSSQLTTKEEVLRMYSVTGTMLIDLEKELKAFPWQGGQVTFERIKNAVSIHGEIAKQLKDSVPTITAGGLYMFSSPIFGQPKENYDWMPAYTISLIHVLDRLENQKGAIVAAGQKDALIIALRDLKDVTTTWREEVRKKLVQVSASCLSPFEKRLIFLCSSTEIGFKMREPNWPLLRQPSRLSNTSVVVDEAWYPK